MTSGAAAAGGADALAAEWAAVVGIATSLGRAVLALDTSTDVATLALATPDAEGAPGRTFVRQSPARALPSEAVMPALVDVLGEANVAPTQLAALVVGLGPGSFTGLRVGLSTLKGLGYAASVPLYGQSSLSMLAACSGPGRVGIVRDARRGSAYFGAYDVAADGSVHVLAPDACIEVAELDAHVGAVAAQGALRLYGDDTLRSSERGLAPLPVPRAALLVVQAQERLLRGAADDLATLAPAYLQAFVAPG